MTCSPKVATLLAWCSSAQIWIDPRIELVDNGEHGDANGICVFSRDTPIDPLTTLVMIPKAAVLSVRSSSLAGRIPDVVPYGHGAQLALSLALYNEFLQGPHSYWFGYLQSLPRHPVGIALLWGANIDSQSQRVDGDGILAQAWAAGTEIESEQRGEDGVHLLEDVRKYYRTTAYPLLSSFSGGCTMEGFLHAYTLVSSRAFLVDAYHGLAMVPIADAFNHTQDNHVHLESDYDVCTSCGSLSQCPHDSGDVTMPIDYSAPSAAVTSTQLLPASCGGSGVNPDEPSDTCDMVTNIYVPPRSEVFNTYGEHLTNAQLLVRYGFALDGNDNDIVSWSLDELNSLDCNSIFSAPLSTPASVHDRAINTSAFIRIYESIVSAWPREDVKWRGSGLVYQPRDAFGEGVRITSTPSSASSNRNSEHPSSGSSSSGGPGSGSRSGSRRHHFQMYINGDAKLSHQLWIYCALSSLLRVQQVHLFSSRSGGSGGGGTTGNSNMGANMASVGMMNRDELDGTLRFLDGLADRQLYMETQRQAVEDLAGEFETSTTAEERSVREENAGGIEGQSDDDEAVEGSVGVFYGKNSDGWMDKYHHDHHANLSSNSAQRIGDVVTHSRSHPMGTRRRLGRGAGTDPGGGDGLNEVLQELVHTIDTICKDKAKQLGREPQMSMEALGEALDGVDGRMIQTRLAMMEVLCERSILESCGASWEELLCLEGGIEGVNL